MENWGAITYREAALLVDPKDSSAGSRQWVATVVAHELSHQWFGNLVTMEWWTHLWLNEGFASYIEYLAVDHMFPDWDMWTEFVGSDLGRALTLDALKHTHPIEVAVHHPDEISEIFDAVSYAKGASVIRMLAEYLGEKDFRDGLRYYLKKYSYKNTSTIHLWEAFEKVSQKPVAKMMSVWTGKAGYPILTISERNGGLDIEQTRFFSSPLSQTSTKDKTIWPVPVCFQRGPGDASHPTDLVDAIPQNASRPNDLRDVILQNQKVMIDKKRMHVPQVGHASWIKLNAGETGVFRTSYSPALRALLREAVIRKELAVVDRLGLVRDMFDLAYAGHVSAVDALVFASAYKYETNYAIWKELASGITRVGALIDEESCMPLFEKYACEIFRPMIKKVGWKKKKGDTHMDTLLRSLVLVHAGRYGDQDTVAHAQKMFSRVAKNKNSIPADLRSVVYNIVAWHGGSSEYRMLTLMHHKATLHEEKNRIAGALGRFADKKLLKETLELAFSPEVRSQDAATFIASVLANPNGRALGWQFTKKMWPFILKRYGSQKDLSYFVSPLGAHVTTRVADDIEQFFKKNPAPGAERTVLQTLERIRAKALWVSRDKKKLATWIKARHFKN